MKGLKLTEFQLIHNSGADLWDYLFENQPLKYLGDEEEYNPDDEWYDDGISWLTSELLDGELFEVWEDNDTYAYTSMGRHANLKRQTFKALTLQGNSIAGNMTGGAFSMSKIVKARWDIQLEYTSLPWECRQYIAKANASQRLAKWIEENE